MPLPRGPLLSDCVNLRFGTQDPSLNAPIHHRLLGGRDWPQASCGNVKFLQALAPLGDH